jgi:hypothetical protein
VLEELLGSLGPGWIPIELADAHYAACDKLSLTDEELSRLGRRVGDRVQEKALVSSAKRSAPIDYDHWALIGQLHRVWARIYQGGSVQAVKLGPKAMLLELRSFVLTRHRYYRHAKLAAICAAYVAVGAQLEVTRIVSYSAARDELVLRLSWA